MKTFALLGATALITSSASATFTGWSVTVTAVSGYNVYSVFANFNNSTDIVLNVFDFGKAFSGTGTPPAGTVWINPIAGGQVGSMGATHNDNANDGVDYFGTWTANAGTWSGTSAAQTAMASWDSYVTMQGISTGIASNNWGTTLDPSFRDDFSADSASNLYVNAAPPLDSGPNAGWFDSTPGTPNGVGAAQSVKLLQISRIAGNNSIYTANMTMGYKAVGTTTPLFGMASFTIGVVPAPGALALLGLVGAFGRRRR